jgi:hypothetical protein
MNKVVYHFTASLNLPWIIESGALKPSRISDAGIGYSTLLWATAKRDGYKTSGAARMGFGDLFRLTLPAEGFLTWSETARQQGWTDCQVATLEWDDWARHGEDSHDQWHCRADPLPLAAVLKAEIRIRPSVPGCWRRISLDPGLVVRTDEPDRLGYRLGRKTLFAVRWANGLCMPSNYVPFGLDDGEPVEPESEEDRQADAPMWPDRRLWRLWRTRTMTGGRNE